MEDPINNTRIDIRTITGFQSNHFFPNDEDEDMDPIFTGDTGKSIWAVVSTSKMKMTSRGNPLSFQTNNKFHYLLSNYLVQKLPHVRVKAKFDKTIRIRWTHNLAHNVFPKISLKIDDDCPSSYDSIWMDDYKQWMLADKDRDDYDHMIGNRTQLSNWTDRLPIDVIELPLIFSYTRSESLAFPLFLLDKGDNKHTLSFDVLYRPDILDLLMMQKLNTDGVWETIKPNSKYLNIGKNAKLGETPEMWGRYSQTIESQLNWASTHGVPSKFIYIQDVYEDDSENPVPFGTTVPIEMRSKTPAIAAFTCARKEHSELFNAYSYYTTESCDLSGPDPISRQGIKYGGSWRVPERDSFHDVKPGNWGITPSTPIESGYHVIPLDVSLRNIRNLGPIPSHNNAKMSITLGETYPIYPESEDDDGDDEEEDDDIVEKDDVEVAEIPVKKIPKYDVFIRTLTWRKIFVGDNGDLKIHLGDDDKLVSTDILGTGSGSS